jgi:hypothetical protein
VTAEAGDACRTDRRVGGLSDQELSDLVKRAMMKRMYAADFCQMPDNLNTEAANASGQSAHRTAT